MPAERSSIIAPWLASGRMGRLVTPELGTEPAAPHYDSSRLRFAGQLFGTLPVVTLRIVDSGPGKLPLE